MSTVTPEPDTWVTIEVIRRDLDRLLSSRRLRAGNAIGSMLGVFSRRRGERADLRLRVLLDSLGTVRAGNSDGLRPLLGEVLVSLEKLERSRRWKVGQLVGFVVTAGRRRNEPANLRLKRIIPLVIDELGAPVEHVWGIERVDDLAEVDRLYSEYIRTVEPTTRARWAATTAIDLHVIVDARSSLEVGVGATLASTELAVRDTTVVVRDDTSVPDLPRDVRHLQTDAMDASGLSSALESSAAPYVLFVQPGDLVASELPHALGALKSADAVVIDHDHLGLDGTRTRPAFKPSFSPDFLLEADYIGRGIVFSREAAMAHWGQLDSREPLRELVLRIADSGGTVAKVDGVLLHLGARTKGLEASTAFATRVLARRGTTGAVSRSPGGAQVRYDVPGTPLVSIIIPFKDTPDLIKACVDSITRLSSWENFEILLVDNQSTDDTTRQVVRDFATDPRIRLLEWNQPFNFASVNNWAAAEASGEYLIFLNSDTVLLSPDWIEEFVGYASQPHVGAVGAKLLYADGSVQHGGVVIGLDGLAGHLFARVHEVTVDPLYTRFVRNCSAVTAACLAIGREKFDAVGGFDEAFELTGNDVDLGLRLLALGFHNVWNPRVQLIHVEKGTRGGKSTRPGDTLRSLERYRPYLTHGDPFYNSELSLGSTRRLPRSRAEPPPIEREVDEGEERRHREASVADFLRLYDFTTSDLEHNALVLESFRLSRPTQLRRIIWFVPPFDNAFRGGIHTILRIADAFTRFAGSHNEIVIYEGVNRNYDLDENAGLVYKSIQAAFPSMDYDVTHLSASSDPNELRESDVAFATLWTGAYHLLKYNRTRGKFYLVQDFEPAFRGSDAVAALAEQTYRFGFDGVANTPGVAARYRSFGNRTISFIPGVDRKVFYPQERRREHPVSIVFYGRPNRSRNGFELGAEALRRVKKRFGKNVIIRSVGAEYDTRAYGLDGVLENLGVLPDFDSVAALYRESHIGLVFMFTAHPSYQPLEYMASGCVTVTNINESNSWLLRDGKNAVIVPPAPTIVADAVSRLIEDGNLREDLVKGGLETVVDFDWEPQLERVVRWIVSGEEGE